MREPLVFLGPNEPWDLHVFETVGEARCEAEPVDVRAGAYGEYGWDADGRPVILVATPGKPRPFGKLLGLQPTLEVEVRELVMPAEPEALRNALLDRIAALKPDVVEAAKRMPLDELINLARG